MLGRLFCTVYVCVWEIDQALENSSLVRIVDVVQGVRTGPVASTGRGVAVIGVTSRMVSRRLLITWKLVADGPAGYDAASREAGQVSFLPTHLQGGVPFIQQCAGYLEGHRARGARARKRHPSDAGRSIRHGRCMADAVGIPSRCPYHEISNRSSNR